METIKSTVQKKNSLTDLFGDIFSVNKGENTVFGYITKKIIDMICVIDESFLKKDFKLESEVDAYIEENTHIIDLTIELLEIYASVYCYYIDMLNQESTLRLFSFSSDDKNEVLSLASENARNNQQCEFFGRARLFDLYTLKSFSSDYENNILNRFVSYKCVEELYNLTKFHNSSTELFVANNNIIVQNNKQKYTKDLEKVLKTLTTSDIYQGLTFDLLKQSFNFYLNNIRNISYEDIKNETIIKDSKFNIESIIMNVFNTNYMNAFYNKKKFLKDYNSLFDNEIKNLFSANSLSNKNVLDVEKLKELRKIKSLRNQIRTVDSKLLNSDFYSYVVNLEDLNKVNYDSLIKIKINLIDHSRLDRMFLPKILYFSPILFSKDFYSNEVSEDNGKIGVYQVGEYGDNRIRYFTLESLKTLQIFRNIIVEKFEIKNIHLTNFSDFTERNDVIIEEIFNNHITSNSIENIIDILHNIKLDEKQILNKISKNTYDVFKILINNEMFFDVFNTNKDVFIDECFTYNLEEDCYFIKSTRKKYDKIVMFIKYLSNIMSEENDANILNNIKNYVNLNFNINTSDFLFIVNNNNLNLEASDDNTYLIGNSGTEISKYDKLKYYLDNIDIDNLMNIGVYTFYPANTENIDNYSISITSEVV